MNHSESSPVRRRLFFRPQIESLEDRRTPSGVASLVSSLAAPIAPGHVIIAMTDTGHSEAAQSRNSESEARIERDFSTGMAVSGAQLRSLDLGTGDFVVHEHAHGKITVREIDDEGASQLEFSAKGNGQARGFRFDLEITVTESVDAGPIAGAHFGTVDDDSPGSERGRGHLFRESAVVGDDELQLEGAVNGSGRKQGKGPGAEGQGTENEGNSGGRGVGAGVGLTTEPGTSASGGGSTTSGSSGRSGASAPPVTPTINAVLLLPASATPAAALTGSPLAAFAPVELPAAGLAVPLAPTTGLTAASEPAPATGSGAIQEVQLPPAAPQTNAAPASPAIQEADLVTTFQPIDPVAVSTVMRQYLEQIANLGDELTNLLGSVGPSAWIMMTAIAVTALELARLRRQRRAPNGSQRPLPA
jgi:hypothetical protein